MREESLPTFDHEALEADLKRLALEIQRQEKLPENRNLGGEALLKKSLESIVSPLSEEAGEKVPTSKSPSAVSSGPNCPLPDYAQSSGAKTKLEIEYFLDMAFHHGLDKAVSEARKSSPFVLDAFHDALAGKLYPELKKRGVLK